MTTRELADLIRDHLNTGTTGPVRSLGFADSVTVPDPTTDRPKSAEFVVDIATEVDGTFYRVTVTDLSQICKHPESAEREQTFSYCTLCGEVTSE